MSFPPGSSDLTGTATILFGRGPEDSVQSGDWTAAAPAFARFRDQMQAHFEPRSLLFPAVRGRHRHERSPTEMMRYEHEQMRGLLSQLAAALRGPRRRDLRRRRETLLMLMQQHNMKEEKHPLPHVRPGAGRRKRSGLGRDHRAIARNRECLNRA